MKGVAEFLILFIPFLLIGLGAIWFAYFGPLTDFVGIGVGFVIAQVVLVGIAILCLGIDVFALLVQYINWKYYSES